MEINKVSEIKSESHGFDVMMKKEFGDDYNRRNYTSVEMVRVWAKQEYIIRETKKKLSLASKVINGLWFANGDSLHELEAQGIFLTSEEQKILNKYEI